MILLLEDAFPFVIQGLLWLTGAYLCIIDKLAQNVLGSGL